MALSITVNGGGTFSASMEEGPVSFTATLGAVPGPKGDTGATGPAGVVAATAPITYDSGTQTVGISATPTFTSVTAGDITTNTLDLVSVTFSDNTVQTTAFVGEARKVYVTARNNSGSTIAAGKVVYLSGATGNKPTIALAQANAEGTSARVIGLTVESIANNADGKVIVSGAAENIDTSAFNAGDVVYLSATTAGGMTTTLPTQPYHGVAIGVVTRANPSVGSVEVSINNYQELEELSDVLITSKANLDLLSWDSASSTWQNKTFSTLGLLTSADAAATYLAKASNLSDLASASTARSNLGLGTMATETASNYLTTATASSTYLTQSSAATTYAPLASPAFTGNPTAPTPSTSDNDTSVATTAFVNAYCPAASTTTAGKVELATVVETIVGTDTTRAITPDDLFRTSLTPLWQRIATMTSAVNGASTGAVQIDVGQRVFTGTTSGNWALYRVGSNATYPVSRGKQPGVIDFSKCVALSGRVNVNQLTANSTFRFSIGKNSSDNVGNLPRAGIGFRVVGTGAIEIMVHNGTSLNTNATSFTPTANTAFDFLLVSDGTGTTTLFVNDSSVGTCTGSPTGDSANTADFIQFEAEATGTLSGQTILGVNNLKVFIGT